MRELALAPETAAFLRREIRHARGREVLFVARVTSDRRVVDPQVLARGDRGKVLAATRFAPPGSLVVHNHPSGVLEPSEADLAIAHALHEEGYGFAIIDNDATELYVVVEPPRPVVPIDPDEVEALLAPGGPLAARHPAYEDRPGQRAYARRIAEVLNTGGVALLEAGTGTGKTFGYLVPLVQWARANSQRVLVATHTIPLQEQLVQKDIPAVLGALGGELRAVLLKGRRNYVSLRRLEQAAAQALSLLPDEHQAQITALLDWSRRTGDGTLSDLPFQPHPDVWDEVASDTDLCLRSRCPHFQRCFYQRARRLAFAADVVVVNHALLLSHFALQKDGGQVIPDAPVLVLDEAHNLEYVATEHLAEAVSRAGLLRRLRRLEHRNRGLLPTLQRSVDRLAAGNDLFATAVHRLVSDRLRPALAPAGEAAGRLFGAIEDLLAQRHQPLLPLDDAFFASRDHAFIEEAGRTLREALGRLVTGLRELERHLEVAEADDAWAGLRLEVRGALHRLAAMHRALLAALDPAEDGPPRVRWAELRRERGEDDRPRTNVLLVAAPVAVAEALHDLVTSGRRAAVLTSATLTVAGRFDFLRERLGVPGGAVTDVFPSPFDFARQACLFVPTDLPVPTGGEEDEHRIAAVADAVLDVTEASRGGVFVLFTSYRDLRAVAARLRTVLPGPVLVQGEAPRSRLLAEFRRSGDAVLLGTASFWEGVDVPGEALRALVIARLPFRVPSDPVVAARTAALEAEGRDAFRDYLLPYAALRLRQGVGRLVRTRTDRGVLVVLDPRLVTRSYGATLLASLPPDLPVRRGPWESLRREISAFYACVS